MCGGARLPEVLSVMGLSVLFPLPSELAGPQRLRSPSPRQEAGTLATGAVSHLSWASSTGLSTQALGPKHALHCAFLPTDSRQKSTSSHSRMYLRPG